MPVIHGFRFFVIVKIFFLTNYSPNNFKPNLMLHIIEPLIRIINWTNSSFTNWIECCFNWFEQIL